ncbi:hypothetical protein D3C86_1956190 [compost metagenome]
MIGSEHSVAFFYISSFYKLTFIILCQFIIQQISSCYISMRGEVEYTTGLEQPVYFIDPFKVLFF